MRDRDFSLVGYQVKRFFTYGNSFRRKAPVEVANFMRYKQLTPEIIYLD